MIGRTAKFAAILFCFMVLCAPAFGAAQSMPDFATIDQQVSVTPKSAETSVKSLAAYLNSLCKNDLEKTRAIYDWITLHIVYDAQALVRGNYGSQDAEKILKTRKAVCGGYVNLFGALAKVMNLDQVAIPGYSRGVGYIIGMRKSEPDHAWNAVKTNGKWRLIDCAWGAGYLDSNKRFVHNRNYHFFLTAPEKFIYDHFPEESKWQLLDKPIDKSAYDKQVCLKPSFFDYDLGLISHRDAQLVCDSKLRLLLSVPNDVLIAAEIHEGNAECEEATTLVKKADEQAVVIMSFPKTGNYLLHLYAARKTTTVEKFNQVATYVVKVNSMAEPNIVYPNACDSYYTKNVSLESPMDAVMELGKVELFKLIAPNAEAVQVLVGSKWYKLQKDGDTFEGEAEMDGNRASIGAKYPEKNQYIALVEYKAAPKQTAAR
ncbi:MAG: hypothetical protein NT018_10835 [Armatimonadetes bacterium]|nr:hypothetical protein [Armatimonadota bacterium]